MNETILPDEIIETLRQLQDDSDNCQFAIGDLLAATIDEFGHVYRRADIIRRLAIEVGSCDSTLRERENVSRFVTQKMREIYILSFSQWRACKHAGPEWEKYAKRAIESADDYGGRPAPVSVIRNWIKQDKNEVLPNWKDYLEKAYRLLRLIEDDEQAPFDARKSCTEFMDFVDLNRWMN